MSLYTLFDTPYAQARDLADKSIQALTFLIKNGSYVILPENQISDIASAKLFSSTPMSKTIPTKLRKVRSLKKTKL